MPKKHYTVEDHPKKKQIDKLLIKFTPYSKISERYGMSKAALSRYLNEKLLPAAAEATVERSLKDGNFVLDEIGLVITKMRKLLDACEEYLADPADGSKYNLLPRAWEQEIRYLQVDKATGYKTQETMSVQDLIDKMAGEDMGLQIIKNKTADPRKMITDAANAMGKQLELLARIQGQITDVSVNIIGTQTWNEVTQTILMATEGMPEAREKLVDKFSELEKRGK